jgi:hypothetical protein
MNNITRNINNIESNVESIVANKIDTERYKRGYRRLYQATLLTRSRIQAKLASL